MAWLCNTPMKGRSLGAGFRREVSHRRGCSEIFRWFLKRQHEDQELLYGDYDDDAAEPWSCWLTQGEVEGERHEEGKTKRHQT